MNDPLRNPAAAGEAAQDDHDDGGGDDNNNDNGAEQAVDFTGSVNDGGMSGRKEWKARHKKGKFNPLMAKHNEHRQAGSFIKSKNYK